MSLKEEIDKLIEAERKGLEVADQRALEHRERQRQHFAPLAALLAEIKASVEPKYLDAVVYEDRAIVKVGRPFHGLFEVALRWEIAPYNFGAPLERCVSHERPGFCVEETRWYNFEHAVFESQHVFADAAAVAEYLIAEIAKEVALYEHQEAIVRGPGGSRSQP